MSPPILLCLPPPSLLFKSWICLLPEVWVPLSLTTCCSHPVTSWAYSSVRVGLPERSWNLEKTFIWFYFLWSPNTSSCPHWWPNLRALVGLRFSALDACAWRFQPQGIKSRRKTFSWGEGETETETEILQKQRLDFLLTSPSTPYPQAHLPQVQEGVRAALDSLNSNPQSGRRLTPLQLNCRCHWKKGLPFLRATVALIIGVLRSLGCFPLSIEI